MNITSVRLDEDDTWEYGETYVDGAFSSRYMKLKSMTVDPNHHFTMIHEWVRKHWPDPFMVREVVNPTKEYLEVCEKWPLKNEKGGS